MFKLLSVVYISAYREFAHPILLLEHIQLITSVALVTGQTGNRTEEAVLFPYGHRVVYLTYQGEYSLFIQSIDTLCSDERVVQVVGRLGTHSSLLFSMNHVFSHRESRLVSIVKYCTDLNVASFQAHPVIHQICCKSSTTRTECFSIVFVHISFYAFLS